MCTRINVIGAGLMVLAIGFSAIGHSQDAPDQLIRKTYDVSRLIARGADETDLVELVTSVIQTEEWERVGGRGGISVVQENQLQVLQRPAAHEELARLLDALSKMPALNEKEPISKKPSRKKIVVTEGKLEPKTLALIVYDVTDLVPTGDYDALVVQVTHIEPPTWDDTGGLGVIMPVPAAKALVIVQTVAVHRQIQDLLRRRALQPAADRKAPASQN